MRKTTRKTALAKGWLVLFSCYGCPDKVGQNDRMIQAVCAYKDFLYHGIGLPLSPDMGSQDALTNYNAKP